MSSSKVDEYKSSRRKEQFAAVRVNAVTLARVCATYIKENEAEIVVTSETTPQDFLIAVLPSTARACQFKRELESLIEGQLYVRLSPLKLYLQRPSGRLRPHKIHVSINRIFAPLTRAKCVFDCVGCAQCLGPVKLNAPELLIGPGVVRHCFVVFPDVFL